MSVASSFEVQMLGLINQERAALGLASLSLNARLNSSAEFHSTWMLEADVFSHTGAGGSTATGRMQDAGYQFSGSWASGENIAWQSERGAAGIGDDVVNLHQALMNSTGHRANILSSNYSEIGIGIELGFFTTSGGQTYTAVMVSQNFARSSADNGGPGQSEPPVVTPPVVTPPVVTPPVVTPPVVTPLVLQGTDKANRLTGSDQSETINGRGGNDKLDGRGGTDVIFGGSGRDTIIGGIGDDRLDGGTGRDQLTGGIGADSFVFARATGSDRVSDFADNIDTLVFASGLWDGVMSAQVFVDTYARDTGSDILFSFGGGDQVLVTGIGSIAQLYDDVMLMA